LRNILIQGYVEVESCIVWDVVTTKFSALRAEVQALLKELGP
jgi:uncharacterized protein with HEPN domain